MPTPLPALWGSAPLHATPVGYSGSGSCPSLSSGLGSSGKLDDAEAGLWPCRLMRSLGLRWHTVEQPLLRVTRLTMRGCPHSKHRELGCHPYLVVRHSTLKPREWFGESESAHPRLLKCSCSTQEHRRLFDSRRHMEPHHVDRGAETTFVTGSEMPPLVIKGDTKFILYDKPLKGLKTEIGHFWVHTAFLAKDLGSGGGGGGGTGGVITFKREEMDKACKKKYADRYPEHFEVALHFESESDEHATNHDLFAAVEVADDDTDDEGDNDEEDKEYHMMLERSHSMSGGPSAPRRLSDSMSTAASAAASAAASGGRSLLGLLTGTSSAKQTKYSTAF